MMNSVVLYYSKTGNSQFIAEKLAAGLSCNSKKITPVIDNIFILFLLSLLRISIPTNISINDVRDYDGIILVGPIWGGQLISPLRSVLHKCVNASKDIHFAVTCETRDEDRDSKYGYAQVLQKARVLGAALTKSTAAFSSQLVNMQGKTWSPKPGEKIKISTENYDGPLKVRVDQFALLIKSFYQKAEYKKTTGAAL